MFEPINHITKEPEMQNLKPMEKLPGDIGKFLGNLERYKLAMTLEGDQGAGKTQLAFQLANAFASVGYTVAYYAIELGKDSELIQRHKNKYIAPQNRERVFVSDNNLLSTIKDFAEAFDVVIIDSFTKLKYDDGGEVYSKELDALRRVYRHTIWIPLFQRNSKNTIRGGPGPLFDASINIEVHKVDDTFVNNYAVCTKNRYTIDSHKLNISTGKIIPPQKTETIPAIASKKKDKFEGMNGLNEQSIGLSEFLKLQKSGKYITSNQGNLIPKEVLKPYFRVIKHLINDLQKKGFTLPYKTPTISGTVDGISMYITAENGDNNFFNFRISDHPVLNSHRVANEYHFGKNIGNFDLPQLQKTISKEVERAEIIAFPERFEKIAAEIKKDKWFMWPESKIKQTDIVGDFIKVSKKGEKVYWVNRPETVITNKFIRKK